MIFAIEYSIKEKVSLLYEWNNGHPKMATGFLIHVQRLVSFSLSSS